MLNESLTFEKGAPSEAATCLRALRSREDYHSDNWALAPRAVSSAVSVPMITLATSLSTFFVESFIVVNVFN